MSISEEEVWDYYHKKMSSDDDNFSKYAQEKEVLFPKKSIIVDLGGGTGSDAMYFLEKGHSVIILDISEFALQKAIDKAKKMKLDNNLITKQVDFGLHQMPIKANTIDIAYSRISLNYFGSDHTIRLFKDIYTILKNGGKAFLTFKSSEDVEEIQYLKNKSSMYEENVFIFHNQLKSRFSRDQLRQMLNNAEIKKYEINPYIEELSDKNPNNKKQLFTNEVIIYKS